jgi:hypothetical protein
MLDIVNTVRSEPSSNNSSVDKVKSPETALYVFKRKTQRGLSDSKARLLYDDRNSNGVQQPE